MGSLMRAYTRSFETRPYVTLLIANGLLMSIGDGAAQTLGMMNSIDGIGAETSYDFVRTFRFAFFGASMGPLAGAWNKFLEVKFPLRFPKASSTKSYPMQKVKVEDPPFNPIPGFAMPKGAKLERGAGGNSASPVPIPPTMNQNQGQGQGQEGPMGDVSVVQLAKRVAADQLGMAPISLFIFLMSMGLMEGLDDEQLKHKIVDNWFPILLVNWQVWPILQLINFRYVPLKYRVPYGSCLGILWTCFLSFRVNNEAAQLKAD